MAIFFLNIPNMYDLKMSSFQQLYLFSILRWSLIRETENQLSVTKMIYNIIKFLLGSKFDIHKSFRCCSIVMLALVSC